MGATDGEVIKVLDLFSSMQYGETMMLKRKKQPRPVILLTNFRFLHYVKTYTPLPMESDKRTERPRFSFLYQWLIGGVHG